LVRVVQVKECLLLLVMLVAIQFLVLLPLLVVDMLVTITTLMLEPAVLAVVVVLEQALAVREPQERLIKDMPVAMALLVAREQVGAQVALAAVEVLQMEP
jgi:hypothetical protein